MNWECVGCGFGLYDLNVDFYVQGSTLPTGQVYDCACGALASCKAPYDGC